MSGKKPKFDPSKPFDVVAKPKFDPSQPFDAAAPDTPDTPASDIPDGGPLPVLQRKDGSFNLDDSPVPGPSVWDRVKGGAQYTLDSANRAATNWLEAATGGAGHAVIPHILASIDAGREMLNATEPRLYDDRVKDYQREYMQNVDPSAVAIGSVPLSVGLGMVAPAANTLTGLGSLNLLQAAGNVDRTTKNLGTVPGMLRAGGEAAAMTTVPYLLKGAGWIAGQTADAVAPVAQTLRQFARGGYVKPTPEVERLMADGLRPTLGQMDPGSPISRFEEIAANNATGSSLSKQRAAVGRDALDILTSKAAAPGASLPTPGAPIQSQVAELKAGYSKLYDDALKDVRISPDLDLGNGVRRGLFADPSLQGAAKTKGSFELAVDGVKDASASVKDRALAWLTDAAETKGLTPYKTGSSAGDVDAASLQALRTKINDKLGTLGHEGDDRSFREIYERAKDSVTEILHSRLPPENADSLRAADSKYRDYLAVKDAASGKIAHRNGGEFTANDLLDSIWRNNGGVSPELDQAARDVRTVMNPTYPKTGALPGAANTFLEGKYIGPMFAKLANSDPTLQAHALGQLPAPAWLRGSADTLGGIAKFGPMLQRATDAPLQTATAMRTLGDLVRSAYASYSEGR